MLALTLPPPFALFAQGAFLAPTRPLRTLWRTAGARLRPSRKLPHTPRHTPAQDAVLASGQARLAQGVTILGEERPGPVATLVLGGFVPDATEQVYLLRSHLLGQGSVYYLNYPRGGFSTDLICAQLDDLVAALAADGRAPVILGVSYGAGLALEWLRRARLAQRTVALRGLVLVSPVACAADVLPPGEERPSTLLGRALQPFFRGAPADDPGRTADAAGIAHARKIFAKMFEAGAQNKDGLRGLLTAGEVQHLRTAVLAAIEGIDARGACERVGSLQQFTPLTTWLASGGPPLATVPTLILYAEKEGAVLAATSPTRFVLENARQACFPTSTLQVVRAAQGAPVQHASLIFHAFHFLPPIADFYRQVRRGVRPSRAA